MDVQGSCTDNFFPIKDLFKKYLEEVDEGAGFSVVKNNKILINIFGKSENLKENWDNTKIIAKPTIQNIKCFFKN